MRELHGSDSESSDDWPDTFNDEERTEASNLADSVPSSPVKSISSTPGSALRAKHIYSAFNAKLQISSPSPTKEETIRKGASSRTRLPLPAPRGLSRQHSESTSSEASTDIDSSNPSTRQSSLAFFDSRTSSFSSASSERSNDRRKRNIDHQYAPSLPLPQTSPSPKMRKTGGGASVGHISQPVFGQPVVKPPRPAYLKTLHSPSPVDTSNVFREPSSSSAHFSAELNDSPVGIDLSPVIVAHSQAVQHDMDARCISWGVQYEIARGISQGLWGWHDITVAKLADLAGSDSEAAPKVHHVILSGSSSPFSVNPSKLAIWKELEREQHAIQENVGRGLGLMGDWEEERDWYGGKVQQIATLVDPGKTAGPFTIQLEKLEMRRSSRVSRFLGSRRVLQVRVPKDLLQSHGDAVRTFLKQKFILCGRVFVPFQAKENSVYMMETDDNYERTPDPACGDDSRISLKEFIAWANPLSVNYKQPISKWSTRFALSLSTSVPALGFEWSNILFIRDESDKPFKAKLETHEIMTDGCGFINRAALAKIAQHFHFDRVPTAIQGRIAGSKGLWILHPTDRHLDHPPKLWIRDSQRKIKFLNSEPVHRAHLIMDLVSPNHVTMPGHLSAQMIMNMSHNGVPDNVFTSLLRASLEEEVRKLTDWDTPGAMHILWDAIDKAGHVTGSRLQRQARGAARALGFGQEFKEDADEVEDAVRCLGHDEHSGTPTSKYELAMELIQSGFHPLQCELLREKLRLILKNVIDTHIKKYRITVAQSAAAWCAPDPFGVLNEGEIYFRTSRTTEIITGEVLVSRNPIRIASDIQKVTAVNHPAFADYCDVIIFPVKGERSLASLLGGGDYDGDAPMITWSSPLTEAFTNAEFTAPPDNFLRDNFEKQVETVTDFHKRIGKLAPRRSQAEFQSVLLLGLADTKVGLYSYYHDMSVYTLGYNDKETVRMAYMFSTCLDSSKTGLRVLESIFSEDGKRFRQRKPRCFNSPDETEDDTDSDDYPRWKSKQFILETLQDVGEEEKEKHLVHYQALVESLPFSNDRDLTRPYDEAMRKAKLASQRGYGPGFADELQMIRDHVRDVRVSYQQFWGLSFQTPKTKKRGAIKADDRLTAVRRNFSEGPPPPLGDFMTSNVSAIKASLAYQESAAFGFAMAFRELCNIKASSSPLGGVALTWDFAETVTIKPSFLRALAQNDDDDY